MKIAYITLSCAYNYGAVLQTYATYRFLHDLGHDVKLIDYTADSYQIDRPDFVYRYTERWKKNFAFRALWRLTRYRMARRQREHFRAFLLAHTPMTRAYFSNDELRQNPPEADVFLTGSDQIWNTDFSIDAKPELPYFLDFLPEKTSRIAYASSFGKPALREEEFSQIRELLRPFSAIGVREDAGRQIVEGLGLQASVVADPTLLLGKQAWEELADARICREPYALLFLIFPDAALVKSAETLARKRGLRLIIVSSYPAGTRGTVAMPKVEQWLSYFRHAEIIFTDSFHATVFSLIFEREFVVSTRARYNNRIDTLLNRAGICERATSNCELDALENILSQRIDYDKAWERLNSFIGDSKAWLTHALEKTQKAVNK